MDDDLLTVVLERLEATGATSATIDLVLGACQGEEALASVLGGTAPSRPARAQGATVEPAGAYISRIGVEGFRGIGPPVELKIAPGPGLTVVVGRNGSGKSSLAEAVELLLTGSIDRFKRAAVFSGSWRNLHQPEPCEVRLALVVEGQPGETAVWRSWAPGVDIAQGEAAVQRTGAPRTTLAALGWAGPLATYRPFLSHGDLEALLGRPSDLYDRISDVLGLDDLVAAQARLSAERRTADVASKTAIAEAKAFAAEAAGIQDERAVRCASLLRSRPWALDEIEQVVTGTAQPDDGTSAALDRLVTLAGPDLTLTGAVAQALREAADGLAGR